MTRKEAEDRITELMEEIRDVVLEYNPEEDYLTMAITAWNGTLDTFSFNNSYFSRESIDYYFPLNRLWTVEEEHEA